jgi:tetratricopeptide (TPR) repeat protein
MVQNFHLVWLNGSIDGANNDDWRNSITKLQQVVNSVNMFSDIDECMDFITDVKDEKVLMIISGKVDEISIYIIHDISQVSSIFIFCENNIQHEKWAHQWSKLKGIYTDVTSICEAVKQAAHDCDQNSVSMSFVKTSDGTENQNLDTLDQSFMYTQILKEILLTIDFEQVHFNDFLTYCREQFTGNSTQLKDVDKIEKEYRHHQPIWWYTSNCFLYSMLNKALRTMEVDLIIKMGFFIQDLHNHIVALHADQYGRQRHSDLFTVYRGQGLTQIDFDHMNKSQGGLLSFNNFLSTSTNREVSLRFARRTIASSDLIGVLFILKIDPSISATPFANVSDVSFYQREEEILFSMHSVFRIGQCEQIEENDRLWQVNLTLTSDNDPQLLTLTKYMRKEIFPHLTGWYRLGGLLIKLGRSDKAQLVFDTMLNQATEQGEKASIYQMLGLVKSNQGNYTEAYECFERSTNILEKTLPANHPALATAYSNIGSVYEEKREYSKALSYHEKALRIKEKVLPANHSDLAVSYHNLGLVYNDIGKHSNALSYYEKSLQIRKKVLPANHPDLASSYVNIGNLYQNMGAYPEALSYYEKSLEIEEKVLPTNHPDLAISYNDIGLLYSNIGQYSKALSYYEKSLEIRQKIHPTNHPALPTAYNNIGNVYNNMGEHSKALSYHEKALEIQQKIVPANHPDLAISYNNIADVYQNMREYSKAISYLEKALEIHQKTLPKNHPDLATSYDNIGVVYYYMGAHSNALSYYQKAFLIREGTLPVNHPDLAISYNNIGAVYHFMGAYSKALSYYERALNIFQSTLPFNHPNLQNIRMSIELVKAKAIF